MLQWIASGALGASAYNGGLATAFLGLTIHLVFSLVFVSGFVLAYLRVPTIRGNVIPASLASGVLVWLFMNLIVLPHGGTSPARFTVLFVANGLLGHALFVGLPAALAARRWIGNEHLG